MPKAYGPYRHGRRYRIVVTTGTERNTSCFESEELARAEISRVNGCGSLDEYLAECAKNVRPSTLVSRAARLHMWLDGMQDANEQQIRDKYAERQGKVAVATHHQELLLVKMYYRWCVKRGKIASSPAENIEPVGVPNKGKDKLRGCEASVLISFCLQDAPRYLPVLLGLVLGLRRGEMLELTKRDVDVVGNTVTVWVCRGKTDNAERRIEVPCPLDAVLVQYVSTMDTNDKLFSFGRTKLAELVTEACTLAGVPVMCPHGLRATFATLQRAAGVTTWAIAGLLGHGGDKVSKDHYIGQGADQSASARAMLRVVSGGVQ